MRALTPAVVLATVTLGTACSSRPPPGWAQGGATLVFADASWLTPSGTTVRLRRDGQVFENDHVLYILDRVGRVYDEGRRSVAVLFPDGQIAGNDDTNLGRIGLTNGAPPGSGTAWLSLSPDGKAIILFDEDGQRFSGGGWQGCAGPQLRTCTLLTQLLTLRHRARVSQSPPVTLGFGVGVGVYR